VTPQEGLKVIRRAAFQLCADSIPSNVETIGVRVWAFRSCTALVDVELPIGLKVVIEDEAFSCCTLLESIGVPTTVEKIGEDAFDSCESLLTY